jgi:hypothetical protein
MRVVLRQNLEPDRGLVNRSQDKIVKFKACDIKQLPGNTQGYSAEGHGAPRLGVNDAAYRFAKIKKFAELNGYQPRPVVEFDNQQERTIYADCAVSECSDSETFNVNSRTQIPLIARYAMTYPRSSGQPNYSETRGSSIH